MFDQEKAYLLLSIVDKEIGYLADADTVFVFHPAAADIVYGPVDRLSAVAQSLKSGVVVGCH